MKFAVGTFQTDLGIHPMTLAKAMEERGFEALFFADHTHLPVERRSAIRGLMDLPAQYSHNLDLFVTLGMVATGTTHLRLGTGVCLVTERDPITLAKQVASVDVLSGGRFLFGVGAGWNHEEMANHGTDPGTRFRLMRERIEAMKAIWTQDEAEYHGRHVNFEPIWSWPKPAQNPHPPILVGGDSEHTLKRVIAYGDGWAPTFDPERDVGPRIEQLQRMAAEAGREPLPVSIFSTPARAEVVDGLAAIGVERCVFFLNAAGEAESLEWLDKRAALMEEFRRAGV